MEGYIKVYADDTGIGVQTHLSHFTELDKVLLLRSFAEGLEMDDAHLQAAAKLMPVIRAMMQGKETTEHMEVNADE